MMQEQSRDILELHSNEDISADMIQYLTFFMAGEEYGIDILSVQEIRGWEPMTVIPNSPRFVEGVINLRGTVVPVIDLRRRFKLPEVEYSELTVVIIVKVNIEDNDKIMGIVVDAVSDVYNLERAEIANAPDVGDVVNKEYIDGLINVKEKMVVLLNLEQVLDI